MINKKKDTLAKFFEITINKLNSPILSVANTNGSDASIYLIKFLTAPFRQIEIYVKLLCELHRFTEDHHVDRGDVQRSLEFYSDLTTSVQELRRKKECELDIISGNINNIDEDLFQNGESLFLSNVIIMDEDGNQQDRILLLFPNFLVALSHEPNTPSEFNFESKIPLLNPTNNAMIQIKKVPNIDLLANKYSRVVADSILTVKYCFELILNGNSLLIVCGSHYDMKMWIDLISNQLSKIQFSLNNKSLKSSKDLLAHGSPSHSSTDPSHSPVVKQVLMTSPINVKMPSNGASNKQLSNNLSNSNIVGQRGIRTFSMRPHPPLIPHFQLPNDVTLSPNPHAPADSNSTLKRFMYKKAKLSEPFGKYHGADDDLKLLNVIETFYKTRIRQSVAVNTPESNLNNNKFSTQPQRIAESESSQTPTINADKNRLEANIQALIGDLNETKKSNKELKLMVSNLQKQLEHEKTSRRKLETYIRKQIKPNNDMSHLILNIEHESSI